MDDSARPILIVVAGPNGSGKTTVTEALVGQFGRGEDYVYINPDDIAARLFADLPVTEANLAAAKEGERMRTEALEGRKNIVLETVFSMPDKVAFVKKAIADGYFVRFAFIATDDPEVNVRRVRHRVGKGGHDVPPDKIVARYNRSIANCAEILPAVDRGYVLDNSADGERARAVFRTVDGALAKVYSEMETFPNWCKALTEGLWGQNPIVGKKKKHEGPRL